MNMKHETLKKVEQLEKQLNITEMSHTKGGENKMAGIWKNKFEEMYGITQKMINENKNLRKEVDMLRKQLAHYSEKANRG